MKIGRVAVTNHPLTSQPYPLQLAYRAELARNPLAKVAQHLDDRRRILDGVGVHQAYQAKWPLAWAQHRDTHVAANAVVGEPLIIGIGELCVLYEALLRAGRYHVAARRAEQLVGFQFGGFIRA